MRVRVLLVGQREKLPRISAVLAARLGTYQTRGAVSGAVFTLTVGARRSRIALALSLPQHVSAPRRFEYFQSSRRSV